MNCPQCGSQIQEQARFCASCGAALAHSSTPSTQVQVRQDVGTIGGGEVTGVKVGDLIGDLTVESTVNHVETSVVNGTYVDARTITNNVMTVGPEAMDQIVARLAAMLGADKQALLNPSAQPVPENVSRQIAEVEIAQKEMAEGACLSAPKPCIGWGCWRHSTATMTPRSAISARPPRPTRSTPTRTMQSPGCSRASPTTMFPGATSDSAVARLAEARTAAKNTDPTDARALALRGFIAKTLAQLAEARGEGAERTSYYQEAAHLFETAAKLDPDEPGVHNGLGNVHDALGNLDAAISAYRRAIELAPGYTAAHHDLAIAYEAKMKAEPSAGCPVAPTGAG